MAQRNYTYMQALEKEVKMIFGSFVIGATGAVGTVKGGFKVVRNSAGNYTITCNDQYNRLLFASDGFISASGSGIANVEILGNPATFQATFHASKSYVVQFFDYAGAAADAASGSVYSFMELVRNTDVTVGND